ncbi:hypothetical protein [Thiovibrio frasassiensis]|uniref:Methyl-accepting transducer domain-containing protein n=1 Tax=Thiovibrio frasassiensis TaxID=2984131 RepID=A0A9X4RK83_9BACT|nr:hypothetical protein [Thiovibrio frasassiensis]MDG4474816.1 hypothetical protein [Thiovibrio frasassiensis]
MKNTSNLIEGTVQKIISGNALVSETSESFYVASQATSRIGSIITEMAGALNQQANAVGQINKAIHEIDTVTQSNAAAAEESASSSEELNAQAKMMKSSVGHLLEMAGGAGETRRTVRSVRQHPSVSGLARRRRAAIPTRKALPPVAKMAANPQGQGGVGSGGISAGDEEFADF